jgi:hypothetical protein
MQQRTPKDYSWPQPSTNEILKVYKPVSRVSAALWCLIDGAVAAACWSVASTFNHTWIVPVVGLLAFVFSMLALQCLFRALGSRQPTVAVLKSGLSIGDRFFPWSAISHVDFHENHIHGHHGSPSHHSYRWDIYLENGSKVSLDGSDFGLEYLQPEALNKVLKEKGLLRHPL